MQTAERHVSTDQIARRAYELWEARGCPSGDGSEDWEAAKAELLAGKRQDGPAAQSGLKSWWYRVRRGITGHDM